MFAKCLYREGVSVAYKQELNYVPISDLKQVFEALIALDGNRFNSFLVSEGPGEPEGDYFWSGRAMVLASNTDKQYYCRVYNEDMTESVGVNRNVGRTHELVPIVIGQETDAWRHEIIDLDQARTALTAFVEHGELTDALDWDVKR